MFIYEAPTKTEQNLAADHLSRLENPHQNEFENKEITETFPLETLGSVALRDDNTPWFADFANYHAGNFIVKGINLGDCYGARSCDILKLAKRQGKFLNVIEMPQNSIQVCESLTFGAIAFMGRSRLQREQDFPDCEDSRALSFVFHSQEFHILSFILGIQYPNLID
ncbi:hypothetical protein Tco_0526080 [Tanacetum coccineum]